MQLISVSLHDLQSRMAASQTDWIQYPDESFTQDNATRYYGLRRRSSQTGSKSFCIAQPMQKLGWTERGHVRASAGSYGISSWRLGCRGLDCRPKRMGVVVGRVRSSNPDRVL